MAELIPQPHGIVILVQINDYVPDHRYSGDYLLCGRENDQVSVGEQNEIMMRSDYRDIASAAGRRSQRRVELRRRHLPNEVSSQVGLLENGVGAVYRRPAEINQKMSVG